MAEHLSAIMGSLHRTNLSLLVWRAGRWTDRTLNEGPDITPGRSSRPLPNADGHELPPPSKVGSLQAAEQRVLNARGHVTIWSDISNDVPPMRLVVSIDTARRTSAMDDGICDMLTTVVDCLARAFDVRFRSLERARQALLMKLTPAQRRSVLLLVEGKSEPETAKALGLSRHTVHDHLRAIYRTWGVNTRPDLRALWLCPPPPEAPGAAE